MIRGATIGIICFFIFSLDAAPQPPKKYTLSVCALFANEGKNIREWIEYHRLIGVDHFYLYENGANDGYMRMLRPYISQKIVTLIPWPDYLQREEGENLFKWVLSTQIPAYENALALHAKKETNWLVFLNVDEFLLPVEGNLSDLLERYRDCSGIHLESICFDASSTSSVSSKQLIIESVDLTKSPKEDVVECVQKVIFKPEAVVSSTCAPYAPHFADDKKAVKIGSNVLRVNRYINRNKRNSDFRRKIVVDRRNIKKEELEHIFSSGYDIEDEQREIHRFIPEITKRLNINVK